VFEGFYQLVFIHMDNNQHDALFIFSLLSNHTSTCFGRISSHHQEVECIYVANGTFFTSEVVYR
jgi:hypothetical protein